MSYQVIARKWRPQSFAELVGQDHIGRTLYNSLKSGTVHPALLFTGPRGTGKTSTARILAKSIRCPNAVDFVPCNECQSCQEIAQSSSIDVMEIDGASNNGVDAIRELRDTVGYMPSFGKYKVYIIDEVHMLSTSAFNALLKTLEEPPPHVKFIMATTEVHKIPQTILSRCQRFDFRRISTKMITDHLTKICSKESVVFEPEALWVIARQGDGSMRDSQSLLEQVMTFTNKSLTYEKVVDILGLTDRALLIKTLEALVNRDQKNILQVIEQLTQTATEPQRFAEDFLESLRNLMIVKVSGAAGSMILDIPDSEIASLNQMADTCSEEEIHLLFDMGMKGVGDILKSHDPRLVLEMVLLRMAQAPKLQSLKALLQGRTMEAPRKPSPTAPTPVASAAPRVSVSAAPKAAVASQEPIANLNLSPMEKWVTFIARIKAQDTILGAKLESILFISETDKKLALGAPAKLSFLKTQLTEANTAKKIQGFIDSLWGSGYAFEIQSVKEKDVGVSAQTLSDKKEQVENDKMRQQINEHPLVKTAQAVFKGQIKSIKETP